MRISKTWFTLFTVTLAVMTVLGTRHGLSQNKAVEIIHRQARLKGSADAPVKIIEFLDYQCPSCAKAEAFLRETYNREPAGIFIEARYFPLSGHKNSMKAAVYAECAARQDRFWAYHQRLFESQLGWAEMNSPALYFEDLAKQTGLDMDRLQACVSDAGVQDIVNKDKTEGKSFGIDSTPSFFVNGELVVGFEALKRKLEPLLEKPASSKP